MQAPDHQQRLSALRNAIADIERKPVLADARERVEHDGPVTEFPILPGGLVQEIYADETRDGGASLAFSLAQARTLMSDRRPVVFYVQLAEDAQRLGVPYGPGLSWFGIEPERMVLVRAADMTEFLWTLEEVVSCRAVAGIVADIRGSPKLLDFTASRRLSMRASSNKVSLFLLRYGARRESSASHLRWRLRPYRSGRNPYDSRGLGNARWRLRLEKGRIAGTQMDWSLEWTRNGLAIFSPSASGIIAPRPATALSRPASTLLANRLSQAS